jgi:hypothetical protein
MTPRRKHDVLTEAIVRLCREDPTAFSYLSTATISAPLVEDGTGRQADYARAIAQRLVRYLEQDSHVTLAPIPGTGGADGRGRVTDRRLDQRLKRTDS